MYKVNEIVLYGNEGVCKIQEMMTRLVGGKSVEYYVLKPVYTKGSTIYVPSDSEELMKKMKKILSVEEIMELIHTMPDAKSVWVDNDNLRKEKYREILKNGDRKELIRLIRTLFLHQEKLKDQGKKFHAADDKFFKDAEKVLYDEFAYVLNIRQDEVIPFICEEIEVKAKEDIYVRE